MKVDELLKRLENIKIDEDERREIAEYLAHTFSDKERLPVYHFMTKDKKIYTFDSYENLLEYNEISPDDVFVYVENVYFTRYNPVTYFYPFLNNRYLLPNAYLSKLGLKADLYHVTPATGLKYVAVVSNFSDINRIVVEVTDLDNVANNMDLPTLIDGEVRSKHIDIDEVEEIVSRFISQKPFAGYDFDEVRDIIRGYYEDHDKSLANEVKTINHAYNQIFQPYRMEYDLKSKRIIASFVRKPF